MQCPYCNNQNTKATAFPLTGKDAVVIKPNTMRYGCVNGHKWAIEQEKLAIRKNG